jgi:hypothetical protein
MLFCVNSQVLTKRRNFVKEFSLFIISSSALKAFAPMYRKDLLYNVKLGLQAYTLHSLLQFNNSLSTYGLCLFRAEYWMLCILPC